jgi:hypothetical protein
MKKNYFEKPEGLSQAGGRAQEAIMKVLEAHDSAHSGGQRVFYTPEEWRSRGEQYGRGSELVIVHDGGSHAPFFNHDYMAYEFIEEIQTALQPLGLFVEQCTSWYSAVYKV